MYYMLLKKGIRLDKIKGLTQKDIDNIVIIHDSFPRLIGVPCVVNYGQACKIVDQNSDKLISSGFNLGVVLRLKSAEHKAKIIDICVKYQIEADLMGERGDSTNALYVRLGAVDYEELTQNGFIKELRSLEGVWVIHFTC